MEIGRNMLESYLECTDDGQGRLFVHRQKIGQLAETIDLARKRHKTFA